MADNRIPETAGSPPTQGGHAKAGPEPPTLLKLSELENVPLGQLPALCKAVHEFPEGQKTCSDVARRVGLLVAQAGGRPFVFCCCWALKVLVIPIPDEKDARLVFTRSPVPDYRHLDAVAEALPPDPDPEKEKQEPKQVRVQRLWREVRSLDVGLVKQVIDHLPKPLSEDHMQALHSLGTVYDQRYPYDVPAFDVVLYNVLQNRVVNEGNSPAGYVTISASTIIDKNVRVVRLVVKPLGTPATFALPIVGLVAQNAASDDWKSSLDGMAKVLLGDAWSERPMESFSLGGDGIWKAEVELYVERRPEPYLIEEIKRIAYVGLALANNTVRSLVLEKLHSEDSPEGFTQWVEDLCQADVRSIAGQDHRILWTQVLGDLSHLLRNISLGRTTKSLTAWLRKERIRTLDNVLRVPERYSPLVPGIQELDEIRWDALRTDLLSGSRKYAEMLDGQFIPRTLAESTYNADLLAYYVRAYPRQIQESLLDATQSGAIDLRQEPGKTAWSTFFRLCEERGQGDLVRQTEVLLYKVAESERHQRRTELCAQLGGALWKTVTFGLALGYPVVHDLRRKAYHRYRQRQLATAPPKKRNHSGS